MQHLALGVSYDGQAFSGWQTQLHAPSVQAALEAALGRIASGAIRVAAAGRTDTGVHATQQVVSFTSAVERPEKAWVLGTNSHLPAGVRVRWVREVSADFHARFSALSRRYIYICMESAPDPLAQHRVHFTQALDDAAMHAAAQSLVGEMDFSTFRASGCQSHTPFRRVHRATVLRSGPFVAIDVQANAFLLRMMRNISGALVDVGLGRKTVADFATAVAARSRQAIGKTAPAAGLYLVDVAYPKDEGVSTIPSGALPPLLAHLGSLDRV